MAIQNGLNTRLYVMGNDLSGDANAIDSAGYTQETMETTALNESAVSRMIGRADGSLGVSGYFDNASNKIHATFTSNSGKLPTADQVVLVPFGASVGDDCVGISAKEADYNVSRSQGSVMTVSSTFNGNGMGGEFGEMLTAHDDTHSSAGSGTVVDSGASSASGGAGYMQIMSLASGSVTVKVQHATSSGGTYADLVTFTATGTSDVPTAERVEATGTVNRYLKVTTTGTFSNAVIAVAFSRF
tara:strand:+ start:2585 stop:3313 length:729 start_codon:yes stop_codon:yes gene_type:complete